MQQLGKTILMLFALCLGVSAYSEERVRKGYAYDIDSGKQLYVEVHNETWKGDFMQRDRVQYFFPDGTLFANKTVDYGENPQVPDFELQNIVTGHYESAKKKDEQYEVSFQEKQSDKRKTALISLPDQAVSDAGFDRMIELNWEILTSGQSISKDFLVPSMKRFVTFRIEQGQVVNQGDQRYRKIVMQPKNFFIRLAAGKIILKYDFDAPRLRKFEGVSNMRDERGNNYRVNIFYPEEETKLVELKALQ